MTRQDVILYRGPAQWGDWIPVRWRQVKTRCRHPVAVMHVEDTMALKDHVIPIGSKAVIDLRRGTPPIDIMVEIVRTMDSEIRIHVWGRRGESDSTRTIPQFEFRSREDDSLFAIQEQLDPRLIAGVRER